MGAEVICNSECPRGSDCKPLSNVISDCGKSFVCMGLHGSRNAIAEDIYRHCFVSEIGTDSMYDYSKYDIISVMSVMAESLLMMELIQQNAGVI